MDYELVTVAQLNDEQLKQLAKLHYSVMHTLLSDLGLPMVLRYYQIAYTDPTIQGICLVSPSGELLGWAMGSPHPDMINSKLRTPLPWFLPANASPGDYTSFDSVATVDIGGFIIQ